MHWAHSGNLERAMWAGVDAVGDRDLAGGVGDLLIGPGLWIERRRREASDRRVRHIATLRMATARGSGRSVIGRARQS